MNEEKEINYSPLCQKINLDGRQIEIFIYESENGGWILEAEDVHYNSFVWNETFPSDQDALNEIISVLEDEGIEALFGPWEL